MTASAATYPGRTSRSNRDTSAGACGCEQASRPAGRGDDDVLEGHPEAVPGGLGHRLLPGPGDQEGASPDGRVRRGQGRPLVVGKHETTELLRIAVADNRPGPPVCLLDVHPDRGPGDRD